MMHHFSGTHSTKTPKLTGLTWSSQEACELQNTVGKTLCWFMGTTMSSETGPLQYYFTCIFN